MGGDLASRRYLASLSVLRLLALRQFRKAAHPLNAMIRGLRGVTRLGG